MENTISETSNPDWDLIIESGKNEKNYWKDLWRFRELFYILSWRDLKVRYKQTVLGVAWSVVRPILTTIIFTFIFSKVAGLKNSSNCPYALMVFTGMLPWQFFSNAVTESSNSLIGNANLITKVYFPRMIIPASSVITSLVDLLISLILISILFLWFHFVPSVKILFLPFLILMVFLFSIGVGLLLTSINVKYRDFRFIIPFIVQFGLYISPVGFNSSVISKKYYFLYILNPMVGMIDGFRWCILGQEFRYSSITVSLILTILFLFLGVYFFRKMEKSFADNI